MNNQVNNVKRVPSLPMSGSKRPSLAPSQNSKGSVIRIPCVSISHRPSLTPSDAINFNNNSSRKSSGVSKTLSFLFN